MFENGDIIGDQSNGGAVAARSVQSPFPQSDGLSETFGTWRDQLAGVDWVPDLGQDIGSFTWFRGLATLVLLCGFAISFLPDFGPISGQQTAALAGSRADQARGLREVKMIKEQRIEAGVMKVISGVLARRTRSD